MSEESLVELESSLESEIDLTDTSDNETSSALQKLRFQGESDTADGKKPASKWQFWKAQSQPLSVQSGDITRSSETNDEHVSVLNSGYYSSAKAILSRIFNCLLKIIFFHKKIPVVSVILLALNVVIVVSLIAVASTVYRPNINISLKSFTIPNHPSQKHWDSFIAAKDQRYLNASSSTVQTPTNEYVERNAEHYSKRSVGIGTCTSQPGQRFQYIDMSRYDHWNLELVYKVREGVADDNLLTKERLNQINKIENDIYFSEAYSKVCHKATSSSKCDRLTSVMSSLYPTNPDGSFVYNTEDGFTPNLTASLLKFKDNLDQALWYTGGQITLVSSTNQVKAKLLRSQLSVGLPLPCFDGVTSGNIDEQKQAVFNYYISLVPSLEKASSGDLEVIYGGTGLYDYQVDNAMIHDALLSIVSFVLILVVVYVLSGFSVWLTFFGLYSVFSCFPWAYFAYRIVLGTSTLNVLNIVSVFVVIGIGVDDVFVFINTFKQSGKLDSLPHLHQRLGYTILSAGKATFVTSLTTSVAFFSNAISSIPAVKQFGVFMGLVVIFCYLQVLIVLPLALHIWHASFRYCENCCCHPCSLLCVRSKTVALSSVRLSELEDEEIGDSEQSEQHSEENESANLISAENVTMIALPSNYSRNGTVNNINGSVVGHVADHFKIVQKGMPVEKLSSFLQLVMLYCFARPVLFFQLVKTKLGKLRMPVMKMFCIWVYMFSLILSIGLVAGLLKFSDRPPQLFNSNTNIQKLIDLTGNLTESGILDCIGGCGGSFPYVPPSNGGGGTSTSPTKRPTSTPSTSTPSTSTPSTSTSTPSTSTPSTSTPSKSTPPNTQAPPQTVPPPTNPLQTTHSTHPSPKTSPSTHSPPITNQPVTHNGGHGTSAPVTNLPTPTTNGGGGEVDVQSSLFSSNIVVNVVFGIKDVHRVDSSEFLSSGDYAVQDDSFVGNITCRPKPGDIDLTGSIRALCRICTNISDPKNDLIMQGNYNCFPSFLKSTFYCLYNSLSILPECQHVLYRDRSNVSQAVLAVANTYYNVSNGGSTNLQYMAMGFRSTTNPNLSPSASLKDYQKWEAFLSEELSAIYKLSGKGEIYQGAQDLLSSTFQTSEKWVEVNIEALAVDGSLYGICVSVLLCMLIIVFLTYNWRVFVAIKLTVVNIIFSLLAMFVVFGWKLGIVEAITLTIVVGNSLDYCIHLCEGYMAATPEHIAYVEQFKFMSGASIRIKRVAASISFVGVSIVSSAITTILATIPLLFTTIELFTRFGQILLVNTFLAIIYTLVFCSTFLALFGPSGSKFTKARAINAGVTIVSAVIVYPVMLIVVLYILFSAGVPILKADGNPLFP